MPRYPSLRPAFRTFLTLLAASVSQLRAQTSVPSPDSPATSESSEPLLLDPFVVEADDTGSADYDPTGLNARDMERTSPPFANEFFSDPAFDEVPLGELDAEMGALASARVNAAEVAAGSESINLRGFPVPFRRNGFTQAGVPEVLNQDRSELVIGSLVPVVGRAAPGGIRDVQTARPRGRVSRQFDTSVSTNGSRRAEVRAADVVVPKKSWYIASLGWSGRDGPQKYSESDQFTAGAALAVRHNLATSTLWSFDVLDYRGNPAPSIPEYRRTSSGPVVGPYLPLADFHTYGPNAGVRRQAGSLGFQLESQIRPDLSLSSGTQFFGRVSEQDRFTTGQYLQDTKKFSGVREPTHREEDFQGFTHQTDLTRRFFALDAEHKLLGSLELASSVADDENRGLLSTERNALLPADVRTFDPYAPNYYRPAYTPAVYKRIITDRRTRLGSAAGLVSLRSAFNRGRTVFTTGLRRDYNQIEVIDRRPGAGTPSNPVPRAEKSLGNTSAHIGVNQRVGRRLLVFATASSAVQPSTRVDSRTGEIQDNAATAGFEVGGRAQFFERRLTLGAMAYSYANTDIVRRNPLYQDPVADADQTQPQLVNSGEETFRGLTTQLGWKPVPEWTFTTRAAWIDAITESSPDLPEEEGRALPQIPRFSAAAGLRRAFLDGAWKGFSVGGNVTHIGEVVQNYERPGRERYDNPAYTVANLNAGYSWKAGKVSHSVSASIDNLFDTDLLAKVARVGAERSLNIGWRVAF